MKTEKKQHFLVLVPHRDARIQLQKQSELLIKNGLSNAYPFPHAAVLASISKPLNNDELKKTAKAIRNIMSKEKFIIEEVSSILFHEDNNENELLGYKINNINVSALNNYSEKINKIFLPVLIGSFLIKRSLETNGSCGSWLKNSEHVHGGSWLNNSISFRAAAVANMYWKPIKINKKTCYKWKIGKLFWLPRP